MSAGRSDRARGLGRGLAALLGEDAEAPGPAPRGLQAIPVEHVEPGRFQPRRRFDEDEIEALAASVREKGILQPVVVRPHPDRAGVYELIAGERRWRAAQRAGVHEIPAVVRELADSDALEIALIENIQRQDLTPLEEAQGYRRLLDEFGHTQEALAKVVGRSRSHVANMMRLLGLPDEVKSLVEQGALSAGHARALLNARDPAGLARDVVRRGLNVRQTEQLVRREAEDGGRSRGKRAAPAKSTDVLHLERDMTARLGVRVAIEDRDGRGRLIVEYKTLDQLEDVLERLRRST